MIKDLLKYSAIFGLLYGGHYFLSIYLPEKGLGELRDASQIFLFVLFVKSHVLTKFLSKKFDVLAGQVSLGFSVVKLIFAGSYIMICKKIGGYELSKAFILLFMGSYFVYQTLDVLVMMKYLKEKEAL